MEVSQGSVFKALSHRLTGYNGSPTAKTAHYFKAFAFLVRKSFYFQLLYNIVKALELAHDVKLLLLYETYLWQVDRKSYTQRTKTQEMLGSLPLSRR